MHSIDCLVVGAGVVGLAIAHEFSLNGYETILIDSENNFGTGTSSRNSEVIHAGIYYPKNSLKHQLCLTGNQLLYQFCSDKNVAFQRTGKLIVATHDGQKRQLEDIYRNALLNKVPDLTIIDSKDISELEPELSGILAIWSQTTGIIDSHGLMTTLLHEFELNGGHFVRNTPFISANESNKSQYLDVHLGGIEPVTITTKYLVNSSGLNAHFVAKNIKGMNPESIPSIRYAKGNYFSYQSKSPFSHLIYPIPEPGGLGIHLTLDLNNKIKFGPDVEWLNERTPDEIIYTVNPNRSQSFINAIKQYWPGLDEYKLVPDYSGIRPKLVNSGQDFVIQGSDKHQIQGLVNLFGIESPGLTSCLAIAKYVCKMLTTSSPDANLLVPE